MTEFNTIIYEKDAAGIVYVTLNRPTVLNALNVQMRDDLYQAINAIRDDPDAHVVIFEGAGDRAFCAGADLTEFGSAPSPVIARKVRWERDLWGTIATTYKPMIAAIHGFCLGSGLELSMLCDIRIATQDARFGLPEVGLGIIPAAGGSQTLPRVVHRGHALELALTGDIIDADHALHIGLVNRLVSPGDHLEAAKETAHKILEKDQRIVRLAKEAIVRGIDLPLVDGIRLEAQLAAMTRRRDR